MPVLLKEHLKGRHNQKDHGNSHAPQFEDSIPFVTKVLYYGGFSATVIQKILSAVPHSHLEQIFVQNNVMAESPDIIEGGHFQSKFTPTGMFEETSKTLSVAKYFLEEKADGTVETVRRPDNLQLRTFCHEAGHAMHKLVLSHRDKNRLESLANDFMNEIDRRIKNGDKTAGSINKLWRYVHRYHSAILSEGAKWDREAADNMSFKQWKRERVRNETFAIAYDLFINSNQALRSDNKELYDFMKRRVFSR